MRIIFLLFFFFSFVSLYSQTNDKNILQNYKYRTKGYSAVSLNGNTSGSINHTTNYSGNNASQFAINPAFSGFTTISTDKFLASSFCSLGLGFYTIKNSPNGIKEKQSNFNYALNISNDIKKYKGNRYFQQGISFYHNQNFNKFVPSNTITTINNSSDGNLTIVLGIGKGRVENVTDAQMAYQIISDLQKNNLLSITPTNEQVLNLAKTITNINNRRIFDYRRKHIFEITQIDSSLQKSGIVKDNSIAYFTTLTDNWFYNFNPNRKQGQEKYLQLKPYISDTQTELRYKVQSSDSIIKSNNKNFGGSLVLGIDKNVAKSIKWQYNKGLKLINSFVYNKSQNKTNIIFKDDFFYSNIGGYLQWGYFPNSRTSVNTTVQNDFTYNWDYKTLSNLTTLVFEGNYFVNYNTRINLGLNTALTNNLLKGANDLRNASLSFNFGIQHYIR